jgi:hypothetical protein
VTRTPYCPSCDAAIVAEPINVPLRCKHCGLHLITLEAWRKLTPFRQGYALYMQCSWPTSEISGQTNPYVENTPEWIAFRHGEQRATLATQDGEE